MRCSLFLSSLAAILATATPVVVSAQSPLPTPQFEPLFTGQFTLSSGINTTGPFGTRVHYPITGWVLRIQVVLCRTNIDAPRPAEACRTPRRARESLPSSRIRTTGSLATREYSSPTPPSLLSGMLMGVSRTSETGGSGESHVSEARRFREAEWTLWGQEYDPCHALRVSPHKHNHERALGLSLWRRTHHAHVYRN